MKTITFYEYTSAEHPITGQIIGEIGDTNGNKWDLVHSNSYVYHVNQATNIADKVIFIL